MQSLNAPFPFRFFIASALACTLLAAFARAEVPEPQGFFMGPLHDDVPATLSGARVVHPQELASLLEQGNAVLIDAASFPRKPENLPPEAIWKPAPHENIPGSIWIPGIGEGDIDKNIEAYFRERLSALTGSAFDHPLVFYCHPHCRASWNAAKRAIGYGYSNVIWFPEGAEGWRDAGHSLAAAEPEMPSQPSH